MLSTLPGGLRVATAPQAYFGMRVGSRMTVVRLQNGDLVVHSGLSLTPERRKEVDALGRVAHVIAPNDFHHLYAGEWAAAYPDALVHGPTELAKKRPDLRIDRFLSDPSPPEWVGTLEPFALKGTLMHETVFVHPPSRTLVSSDLVENQQKVDHLPTRLYLKLSGAYQRVAWPRPLRIAYRDKKAARRSIDELLERDFDRAIVAHGDVLETGAKDAIRAAMEWVR
jgi:hypothetical protein